MSIAMEVTPISRIGETAGEVWEVLSQNGRIRMTNLVKQVDAPRDLVMQALGWLAREDKIAIDEDSRGRTVSLK